MDVYSKRTRTPPATLRYDFPPEVRKRVFYTLDSHIQRHGRHSGGMSISNLLQELRPTLQRLYGDLAGAGIWLQDRSQDPVMLHYQCCDPVQYLDFLELAFRSRSYCQGDEQTTVDEVNSIFRQSGIGYEFTPWTMHLGEKIDMGPGTASNARDYTVQYPRAIKLDHLHQHEAVTRPALHLLADSRFRTANDEMLKAHDDYRHGRYDDAITSCGAAFESVLKTICTLKGWAFNADRDTCSQLVGICRNGGLFPGFYAPIFEATGTIRNKLGDAHGRGPTPLYAVGKEHVQHLLQMTSAHIILLVTSAQL